VTSFLSRYGFLESIFDTMAPDNGGPILFERAIFLPTAFLLLRLK